MCSFMVAQSYHLFLAYRFIPWGNIGIENDTPVVGNILLCGSRGFHWMGRRSMISPVPFVLLTLVSG